MRCALLELRRTVDRSRVAPRPSHSLSHGAPALVLSQGGWLARGSGVEAARGSPRAGAGGGNPLPPNHRGRHCEVGCPRAEARSARALSDSAGARPSPVDISRTCHGRVMTAQALDRAIDACLDDDEDMVRTHLSRPRTSRTRPGHVRDMSRRRGCTSRGCTARRAALRRRRRRQRCGGGPPRSAWPSSRLPEKSLLDLSWSLPVGDLGQVLLCDTHADASAAHALACWLAQTGWPQRVAPVGRRCGGRRGGARLARGGGRCLRVGGAWPHAPVRGPRRGGDTGRSGEIWGDLGRSGGI